MRRQAAPQSLRTATDYRAQRRRYHLLHNVVIPWGFILPILLIHICVVAIPALTG